VASGFKGHDVSVLRHETSLGVTRSDSGEGPPANVAGWIRTGRFALDAFQGVGRDNCNGWAVANQSRSGSTVSLESLWDTPGEAIGPFRASIMTRSDDAGVWCVED
jgi:hypothetical protein